MGQSKYYAEFTYGDDPNKQTYRVFKDQLTWTLASTYARNLTGDPSKSYLASPKDANENSAILRKTTEWITPGPDPNEYIWLGGVYTGGSWKYPSDNTVINNGGPNYSNWNLGSYAQHAAAVADPNVTSKPNEMAMTLGGGQQIAGTVTQPGQWVAKDNAPYYYVVEIEPGFTPKFLNINTIQYGASKDIITDYNQSSYNGGVRINSDQLTNFNNELNWTFTSAGNAKKLKRAAKQDYDFVYYKKTGDLYYNENTEAKGWGAGGVFAQFENRYRLTESQITLYTDLGQAF